jgi:hypothetical protein
LNLSLSKSIRSKQVAEYFPKNIGLSLPANTYDYEFLICGRSVPYTQNQIISSFVDHGAMLLSLDSSINSLENKFVLTLCCNLEHSDLSPTELAVQLQSMKFVISAEYCEIRGRLFGRRVAGIAFNYKHLGVALRSGTLLSLGRRLAKETGSIGTSVLYEEGRNYVQGVIEELGQILTVGQELGFSIDANYDQGEDLARPKVEAYCVRCRKTRQIQNPRQVVLSNNSYALQGICPDCSTRVFKIGAKIYGRIRGGPLIENVQAFLMATGWGTFELRTAMEDRFGEVIISDPPTLDGEIGYGNQFVEGIAAGLLEAASGTINSMVLVGENYDPTGRTLRLHFAEKIQVKPRHLERSRARRRKPSPKKHQEKNPVQRDAAPEPIELVSEMAALEVDRVIRALESIESEAKTSMGQGEEAQRVDSSQVILEPVPSQDNSSS